MQVCGELVLLRKELFGSLIEIRRRSWVHQKHLDAERGQPIRARHKVMYLPLTVRALVARKSTKND